MNTCAGKCAKYSLFLYNLIFAISGAGVLGVGIWVRVDKNLVELQKLVQVSADNYLDGAAYALIGFGAFVLIVSFFGCCGALTENRCLLGLYIGFLVIICAGELGGGIAAAIFKHQSFDALQPELKKTIDNNYVPGNAVAKGWDFVQTWFDCCGSYNFTDYQNINLTTSTGPANVPRSCCKLTNDDPLNPDPMNYTLCNMEAATWAFSGNFTYLNERGCFDGVEDELTRHVGVLVGVGVGIAFIEVLGIILACCVCCGNKEKMQKY